MIRSMLVVVLMMPMASFADSLLFGDSANGKKLHKNSCTACHGSEVYTRKDHKIKTTNGLEGRVEMCSTNLNTHYNDEQNSDIVIFLNESYYKFK